ncbi:hypothetical protein HNY73_012271 [Argiope bruennichi]|uniref:DUF5641 domain-containing protein n=1 Tax=Argiope bruennichi TaxID=94029 RepID=A0A8T0EYU5_ARGBR|nr:hypothetical protein HNY73_012271 [Argiope bruennichi]
MGLVETVNEKRCLFCVKPKSDHDSSPCPLPVQERKAHLRRNGICFYRLTKAENVYKNGTTKRTCGKCSRRHSELICDTPTPPEPQPPIDTRGERLEVEREEVVTCSNINIIGDEVLLETCSALLKLEEKRKMVNILLLNKASQRCFLKEKADTLKLPIMRREKLLVYTFGSRDPIAKTYEVVKFTLCNSRDSEKSIEMEALLCDVISSSPFKVSSNKREKFENIKPRKKTLTPLRRSNAAVTSSSTPDKKLEPVKEDISSKKTELDSSVKKVKGDKKDKHSDDTSCSEVDEGRLDHLRQKDEDSEEPVPLIPAHLLMGRRVNSLPPVRLTIDTNLSDRKTLIKRFNYRKRHLWKLGKVVAVFLGRDGKVRSCQVKKNTSVIKRPVQLLYNLEMG